MEILRNITQRLLPCYPDGEARALARMVLEERFSLSMTDILMGKDKNLSAEDRKDLENIVARLLKNEPIQYILEHATFRSRNFHVEPGVLIPRPETEELVDWVVDSWDSSHKKRPRILDIGTGSGCIAISLALDIRHSVVSAIDISSEALTVARRNAEDLSAQVFFMQQDILHPEPTDERWDIIVSNPPYVRQLEAADMHENVLKHEPHLALFVSDQDPLLFYREICRFASQHLNPGGMLFFEINQYLATETVHLTEEFGFCNIEVRHDQYGNKRMLKCTKGLR